MPYTTVQLFDTQTLPNTATALVTAAILTRIDRLVFSNPSASPVTVTTNLVPVSGAAGVGNQVSTKVLNAGEDWPCSSVVNAVLRPGDILSCTASTASVVVASGSGTQIS